MFVQKDAPNNLLLGTDVQPHLGFSLIVEGVDGSKDGLLGVAIPTTSAVVGDQSSLRKSAVVEDQSSSRVSTSAVVGDQSSLRKSAVVEYQSSSRASTSAVVGDPSSLSAVVEDQSSSRESAGVSSCSDIQEDSLLQRGVPRGVPTASCAAVEIPATCPTPPSGNQLSGKKTLPGRPEPILPLVGADDEPTHKSTRPTGANSDSAIPSQISPPREAVETALSLGQPDEMDPDTRIELNPDSVDLVGQIYASPEGLARWKMQPELGSMVDKRGVTPVV